MSRHSIRFAREGQTALIVGVWSPRLTSHKRIDRTLDTTTLRPGELVMLLLEDNDNKHPYGAWVHWNKKKHAVGCTLAMIAEVRDELPARAFRRKR